MHLLTSLRTLYDLIIPKESERKGRKKREGKSPAPSGNGTLDITIMGLVFYHCATNMANRVVFI